MDEQEADPCRVADVEWDRAHETLTMIIRAHTHDGLVATLVHDLYPEPGLRWIRGDEIVSIEDLPSDSGTVRLADLRRERRLHVDPALTDLHTLLHHLGPSGGPIAVWTARTGSDEMLVGIEPELHGGRVVLREIDPNGELSGDDLEYELDEIISVEWDSPYLRGLAELFEHFG